MGMGIDQQRDLPVKLSGGIDVASFIAPIPGSNCQSLMKWVPIVVVLNDE